MIELKLSIHHIYETKVNDFLIYREYGTIV